MEKLITSVFTDAVKQKIPRAPNTCKDGSVECKYKLCTGVPVAIIIFGYQRSKGDKV